MVLLSSKYNIASSIDTRLTISVMKKLLPFIIAMMACLVAPAKVIYVAFDASGNNDGTSWTHAYKNFSDALSNAGWNGDSIFIKAGFYYPDRRSNGQTQANKSREFTFFVNKPLSIFGGFAGTEAKPEDRNLAVFTTVLSGNIGDAGDDDDNVYHVLSLQSTTNIVLDGLLVRDGNADGSGNDANGAGLTGKNFTQLAMYNVEFRENEADEKGGGFYITGINNLIAQDVCACGNEAEFGGGAYLTNLTSTTLERFKAINNEAGALGGGLYLRQFSSFRAVNALFFQNEAEEGGAVYTWQFTSGEFINSAFHNNEADAGTSIMASQHSSVLLYNSILWNDGNQGANDHLESNQSSGSTIYHSILQGSKDDGGVWQASAVDGGSNIDADPMFEDPDGADNIVCTADDNFYLNPASPALNSGSSSGISDFPTEDLNGDDRIQGGTVDLGPYEGSGAIATFPVEWLDFSAAWSGQAQRSVDLVWATAQEINSQAFVVERSIDQARTWASIGQVSAAGYSDDIKRYSFSDEQAGELLGVNLQYRIKQVDLDGAFSYSTVQNVSMNHDLANAIQVYPNPARENLYLATDLPRGIEVREISVLDLSGKTLIHQAIYDGSQEVYQLSLGQLKPGSYVVRISHNQGQAGQLIRVLP